MVPENKLPPGNPPNNKTTTNDTNVDLQVLFQALTEHAKKSETKVSNISKSSNKVMSRSEADKFIEKQNDKWEIELIKDAESKRKFRRNILIIVFILLGVQITFLNIIICRVIYSAFRVNPETLAPIIQYETIVIIVDMLKWYTTAVIAELLATLIFIVKAVFEVPKKPK